uniref:RGS domain-containing protein n=2 Tax=Schistosoma mansoni TaxID=6183 RepID=A0A5K4FD30_SCHMA
MNDKSELNSIDLRTNKKTSFRSYRNLSTCLPDNNTSRNIIQDSVNVNCCHDEKFQLPYVQMSKSSESIASTKQENNSYIMLETEKKSNETTSTTITTTINNNNSNPSSIIGVPNIKRNILRRQQCTVEQFKISENITSQYVSTNNLKMGKTFQTEHAKDQQASSSSPTPIQQTVNDTATVTNSGQLSRSGFLRHPLRKAMTYVKPQSESFVSVKSASRRLHHTSTIEKPDDSKFRSSSKSSSRNSLYSNIKHFDLSTKTSVVTNECLQMNDHSNRSIIQEVYTGESYNSTIPKQVIKNDIERKTKQKDIRYLNDLITNILPRSFSNAFKRPVGKCKSASPTTVNDHHIEKLIDSFRFDNFESESQHSEKSASDFLTTNESSPVLNYHNVPTRSQLQQWEQSFDKLLADTDGLSQFHHFLRSEYSEENIEFWLICELYKHLPQEDLGEESRRIYRLYLAPHSPHEVNLDSETRNQTIANISNPTNESFVLAQQTIQGLMNKDSYQRFLRSSFYFELKQLVWHAYPQNEEATKSESNIIDTVMSDNQAQYFLSRDPVTDNTSSPCSEEEHVKEFRRSSPAAYSNTIFPKQTAISHETNLESDIQSSKTISSPLLDCTVSSLFHKDIEDDEELSLHENIIEHRTPNQTNDNLSVHELPNSVHTEAAPHSPKLCYTGYTLCNTDCYKLKQNIRAEL